MADSTTHLDTIVSNQAGKEVTANELFDALSAVIIGARRASTTSGLTWGYYGGVVNIGGTPTAVTNGTVTLTASTTNYVELDPATGVISKNTSGFTASSSPLYRVSTTSNAVTSYLDKRAYQLQTT